MQSKNVLWLGVMFITLLTVFCISKYLNEFNPDIEIIVNKPQEIIDNNLELKSIELKLKDITILPSQTSGEEVDNDYFQVMQLIEQEEKDIEETYYKALRENKNKIKQKTVKKVDNYTKKSKKVKKYTIKPAKLKIETIMANQLLTGSKDISDIQKRDLQNLIKLFKKNKQSYINITVEKKDKKYYNLKNYLSSNGIKNRIYITMKKNNKYISTTDKNQNDIEITLIKKD